MCRKTASRSGKIWLYRSHTSVSRSRACEGKSENGSANGKKQRNHCAGGIFAEKPDGHIVPAAALGFCQFPIGSSGNDHVVGAKARSVRSGNKNFGGTGAGGSPGYDRNLKRGTAERRKYNE